jgi:hypothetical protein
MRKEFAVQNEMTPVTLRFSKKVLDMLDSGARAHGLSRNSFITHLALSWHNYRELDLDEREFLSHLSRWGIQNFRGGRPNLRHFANTTHFTEDGVRHLVNKFLSKGWMEKRKASLGKKFDFDLDIDGDTYGLTEEGLRIAGFCR